MGLTDKPLGNQGALTGRSLIREPDYDLEEEPRQEEWVPALPASCLRVLHSPLPKDWGGGCPLECPGLQRDGSCLCDIVRAANERGIQWKFEIDESDGTWVYAGPPIDAS